MYGTSPVKITFGELLADGGGGGITVLFYVAAALFRDELGTDIG